MDAVIFSKLRKSLAYLYIDERNIRTVVQGLKIDLARIVLNDSAINIWNAILTEATKNNQVDALLDAVKADYGENDEFQKVCDEYERTKSFDTYQQLFQGDYDDPMDIGRLNVEEYAFSISKDKKSETKGSHQNPLISDTSEVRAWFFKELHSKEQSLLLTAALFEGMSRQKLLEIMTDIERLLSTDG